MPLRAAMRGSLHGLVLAAGASSRFGSPKALARLGDATLLEHALRRARAVLGDEFTVILGARAEEIRRSLRLDDVSIAVHDAWSLGLAESLKYAVGCVPASSSAALIMLVDQPAVNTADLRSLIGAWRPRPETAAAAYYAGDVGAPCILPRALFPAVGALSGDRGAKSLLRSLVALTQVPMADAEFDIDTPDDLARADASRILRDISSA